MVRGEVTGQRQRQPLGHTQSYPDPLVSVLLILFSIYRINSYLINDMIAVGSGGCVRTDRRAALRNTGQMDGADPGLLANGRGSSLGPFLSIQYYS